jgi:hypothetical protein
MAKDIADTVELLATTRLGEKAQLTIPKEYRHSLALDPGSPTLTLREGPRKRCPRKRCQGLCWSQTKGRSQAGDSDSERRCY